MSLLFTALLLVLGTVLAHSRCSINIFAYVNEHRGLGNHHKSIREATWVEIHLPSS